MEELVTKEQVLDALSRVDATDGTLPVFSRNRVAELLKEISSVSEKKIGKWINIHGYYVCCECYCDALYDAEGYMSLSLNCPNCGAEMNRKEVR